MAKVNVTLLGLFRLDSGIHQAALEGERVRDLYAPLAALAREKNPQTAFRAQQLSGCMIILNGAPGRERDKLRDGDEVYLLSPVAGG